MRQGGVRVGRARSERRVIRGRRRGLGGDEGACCGGGGVEDMAGEGEGLAEGSWSSLKGQKWCGRRGFIVAV